jgi:hypothetical protein
VDLETQWIEAGGPFTFTEWLETEVRRPRPAPNTFLSLGLARAFHQTSPPPPWQEQALARQQSAFQQALQNLDRERRVEMKYSIGQLIGGILP